MAPELEEKWEKGNAGGKRGEEVKGRERQGFGRGTEARGAPRLSPDRSSRIDETVVARACACARACARGGRRMGGWRTGGAESGRMRGCP